MIIKPVAQEMSISAATTVANAQIIRVYNSGATGIFTLANTTGTIGSFTILANTIEIVSKSPTDTVTGTGMYASPIAFKN